MSAERNAWVFYYTRAEMQKAIENKVAYHSQRLEHWKEEHARVEKEFKEKGITLDDEAIQAYGSSSYHGHAGGQIKIDPKLQQDFADARNKVIEHTNQLKVFRQWETLIKHQDAGGVERTEHKLTYEDAVFFGLV